MLQTLRALLCPFMFFSKLQSQTCTSYNFILQESLRHWLESSSNWNTNDFIEPGMFEEHVKCIREIWSKGFYTPLKHFALRFFFSLSQYNTPYPFVFLSSRKWYLSLCPEYRIGYLSIILSAQIFKICLIHANNIPSLPYSNIYFQLSRRFFPPVTYSLFVYGVGLLLAL